MVAASFQSAFKSMFSEFGDDGGPAAKAIVPKFSVFSKHVTAHTGFQVPKFEIKLLVAGAIAVKGFGSLLFIFGSTIGAFLLILHQLIATPILYDFYNYDTEKKEFTELFIKFTQTSHGQFDGSYGFTLVFTTQACKRLVYWTKSGTTWGTDVFHRDEEHNSKEIREQEEYLPNPQRPALRFDCYIGYGWTSFVLPLDAAANSLFFAFFSFKFVG
ncbi:HR-like lesion-inducer [Tanacetum coccineum]